jgi:glutaryl-CoA dehydrogenase
LTARQFVDDQIIPVIEKHFRESTFPVELLPQLGELGFFGSNLTGYGGAEMSNVAYGLVMQELERGDSGLRSFVSVQSGLVMYPIHTYGSQAQKTSGCPGCRVARPSVASASPSRNSDRTRAVC